MTGITARWTITNNRFPGIRVKMLATARAIVAKTAMDIEAGAKSRAPVDTGTLRNSIQARQVGGNGASGSIRWQVTVGAHYGIYVEWGTRFMAAQPFLRPAVEAARPAFLAALRSIAA